MDERKTRRRMRRVRYEANVYIRGARQEGAVVARAHNLCAEGIAVSALDLPPEGEEVECRMMLGGRRTRLRGRVAWVHRAAPAQRTLPAGGGIQFISLDRQERELLARLVESSNDGPQLVDVWVPGLEHPLPMRALIGTEEVKLGMQLPQLAVGMPLRISFVHRGVSESRNGTIQAVRFLSGDRGSMSRVALQVSTPRPREGAGLIRTEVFEPRRTPQEGAAPAQSMVFDLAELSVPGAAPPPPQGMSAPPAMEDQTPVIPYESYESYEQQMPGQQREPFSDALESKPDRRWVIPALVLTVLGAAVGLAISTRSPDAADPVTVPAPVFAPAVPPGPPRAPVAPAPAPAPAAAATMPPAGIQPLPPRPDRAVAAAKRRKLRAAARRKAALQLQGEGGRLVDPLARPGRR